MDLYTFVLSFLSAFMAGFAGASAAILINEKRMTAVEKVKRRILYGPDKPMVPIQMGPLDPSIMRYLLEAQLKQVGILKLHEEKTATEIMMKQKEAEYRIRQNTSVSPLPHFGKKHIEDILGMSEEEMEKWLRERK